MLNHVFWKPRVRFFVGVLFLCLIFILHIEQTNMFTQSVNAQDAQTTIQQLLMQLDQKHLDNHDFTFSVQFVAPLGSEKIYLIGDPNDRFHRSIEEAGTDHVCFLERADSYQYIRCTPYSNIQQVSYMLP